TVAPAAVSKNSRRVNADFAALESVGLGTVMGMSSSSGWSLGPLSHWHMWKRHEPRRGRRPRPPGGAMLRYFSPRTKTCRASLDRADEGICPYVVRGRSLTRASVRSGLFFATQISLQLLSSQSAPAAK